MCVCRYSPTTIQTTKIKTKYCTIQLNRKRKVLESGMDPEVDLDEAGVGPSKVVVGPCVTMVGPSFGSSPRPVRSLGKALVDPGWTERRQGWFLCELCHRGVINDI